VIILSRFFCIYIIKEFVQPKMSLKSREFLIWRERGRGEREGGARERERERERWWEGRQVNKQAYLRSG
jgi:hypothetical protein